MCLHIHIYVDCDYTYIRIYIYWIYGTVTVTVTTQRYRDTINNHTLRQRVATHDNYKGGLIIVESESSAQCQGQGGRVGVDCKRGEEEKQDGGSRSVKIEYPTHTVYPAVSVFSCIQLYLAVSRCILP